MTSWKGRWVPTDEPPPYVQAEAAAGANPQSRLIPEACRSRQSWRWRWQSGSESCRFVVPTQAELCARLAGKRILLYGDSLTQQFFVSLASIAGNVTSPKDVPRSATPLPPCTTSALPIQTGAIV